MFISFFQWNWLSNNPQIWLDERHTWLHQTKSGSLRCYLPLKIYLQAKKIKILIDSYQWYCWLKNSEIWFDKRHNWLHPIKSGSIRCYLPLMTNSMQKTKISLIFSVEKDDQIILKPHWTRGLTVYTQPKVVASDATFP